MANDFELANRAYSLMSLTEREAVLKEFARLQYPLIVDRFFEAVHVVVKRGSATPSRGEASGDTVSSAERAVSAKY